MADRSGVDDRTGRSRRTSWTALLLLTRGPLIWAAHFAFVYLYQSTACSLVDGTGRSAAGDVRLAIWGATAVALALVAASLVVPPASEDTGEGDPEPRTFHRRVAVALAVLSAFGIAAIGFVAAVVDPCAALR